MPRATSAESMTRQRGPPPPLPTTSPSSATSRSIAGARAQPPDVASLVTARDVALPAGAQSTKRQPPSLQALAAAKILASNSTKATPPSLEGVKRRRPPPPPLDGLQQSRSASLTSSRQPHWSASGTVQNPLADGQEDSAEIIVDVESPDGANTRTYRLSPIGMDADEDMPAQQLTAKQLQDGGRKMKNAAYEACFDSFDLDGSNSLSVTELGMAFEQLGLLLSPADLEALKNKYDEDGNDYLSKSEFLRMVDDFMDSAPQTFSADDWCPAILCCCSLDCIKWGHRKTQMDNGNLSITGSAGPCGIPRLSSTVNVCIEMPKAKWMYVLVGPAGLQQLSMYMWESFFVFFGVITGAVLAQPQRTGAAGGPALVAGIAWTSLRTGMFFYRQRGSATVFAAGNPIDAPKGTFPLARIDADEAVNHFLRCKGVKFGDPHSLLDTTSEAMQTLQELVHVQSSACPACGGADWLQHSDGCTGQRVRRRHAKMPHVMTFSRDQWSSDCTRERHQVEVGENFYRIKRFPALPSRQCQLQRREWMAGQPRDIAWIHTARYGRDIFRLSWWLLQSLCWTVVASLVLATAIPHLVSDASAYAVCSHHPLCDDVHFTHSAEVTTGHCTLDCFSPCANMTCGGSSSSCKHVNDGVCDEPFVCMPGTDPHDCHECNHMIVHFVSGVRQEYLATTNNSKCDEPYDCPYGTDIVDCGNETTRAACIYHDDGHCDEPHLVDGKLRDGPCTKGSDYVDCLYDSEVEKLLADQRLYVLELERMYSENHDFHWLSTVADDSIRQCQLETDRGHYNCVPQACIDTSILEKCSGCIDVGAHPKLGDAQCAPGLLDYPNHTVLCREATRAGQIANTQWCQPRYHSDGRVPCECMTIWEKWQPSSELFWTVLVILWPLMVLAISAFWVIYVPAFVELGHPGMGSITGRAREHTAWSYIEPLPTNRNSVMMTFLQEKLGRHPSPDRLRGGWSHRPLLKHLLTGYSETMEIRKDTVNLVTKGGMPPLPCCRSCTGDSHEYAALLQDTNFIEIGAELHPLFYRIAILCLTFAFALFFSSLITGGLQTSLRTGVCDWRGGGDKWTEECLNSPWSIRPRSQSELDNAKWTLVGGSIAGYFLFAWMAGKMKKGYVLINVNPGGTDRGHANPFAGTSPFFIRLPAGAPDSNSNRYREVINVVRSAAAHSKKLGRGDKRGILRFRTAVDVVLRGIRAGHIILIHGRPLPWNSPAALKALRAMQSEKAKRMLAEGAEQCLPEIEETKAVTTKAKEPYISGSPFKNDEDVIRPAGPIQSLRKSVANANGSVAEKVSLYESAAKQSGVDATVANEGRKMATVKVDKQGIRKVFVEIDVDGSGAISFNEFSKWLSDWVFRTLEEGEQAKHKSTSLQKHCKAAFDAVNADGDAELSMSEFEHFMTDGIIDLFKECGLWGSMLTSNLLDVEAIERCFDRFDVDHSGEMNTEELMAAFHDLEKRPTPEEIDMLLRVYDDDHNGVLNKQEFTRLVLEYVQNQRALTNFAERNWCPINLFGLDFDFVPWGYQYTSMDEDEIISLGDSGFCGLQALSNSNYSSIELSKTRWIHVEGHPAPLWKLNLYLAEALLLFHFLHTHPWWRSVPLSDDDRTVLAEILGVAWYVGRAIAYFFRTRGVATSYSMGKPIQTNKRQQSKGEFPVPIMQLEDVTQAFLDAKGINKRIASRADAFRTKIPGYGFLPLRFKTARGIHSAYFGETHFKLEKVNGGGGSRSTRRFSKVDYLVGLIEDIKWVHTYKLGKSFVRLFKDIVRAMINGFVIVLPIAFALSKSNCKEELDLHRPGLLPCQRTSSIDTGCWNVSMTERDIWTPEQEVYCGSFAEDPTIKPGRPCVCPLRVNGPRICNALLDPTNALIDRNGWCEAFKQAAHTKLQVSDMVPCECMSLIQRYVPDFTSPLFVGLWLVFTIPVSLGTCALWLLHVPIWGELGVQGVDTKMEGHFATFRMSNKNLFERVLQERFAAELIQKILELQQKRRSQVGSTLAPVDSAKTLEHVQGNYAPTVEDNTHDSIDRLAGCLYGLIDTNDAGYIEFNALQRCIDETTDNWVDSVHASMMAELTTRHIDGTQTFNSKSRKDFQQSKKGVVLSEQIMKSADGECIIKDVEDALKAKYPSKYHNLGTSDGHGSIDTDDLVEFGLTPEAITIFHKHEEAQVLVSEIKNLRTPAADGLMTQNKRVQGKLLHLEQSVRKLHDEINALRTGTKIARLHYMQLFAQFSEQYQLPVQSLTIWELHCVGHVQIAHHDTRSQIAMTVLGRKLGRPLRHKMLRSWTFQPLMAYILRGEKQQLMLHEDYVTLRLRGGSPIFCCCWGLTTSIDDYNILLQDIYFIETGHEAKTSFVLSSAVLFIFGSCLALSTALYIAASESQEQENGEYLLGGVDAADESARRTQLYRVFSAEVAIAFLPMVIVVLLTATNRMRRPYVHLGCLPPGGRNGRMNSLGGGSPFHIRLKRGASIDEARDLAAWIRGAAAKVRQDDIARVRQTVANIGRQSRADKVASHVVANTRLGGAYTKAQVDETVTTGDVLASHFASEAEMAAVVGLTELFGSSTFSASWFVRALENMAVVALIVHSVLPEVERATCTYLFWCDWAPKLAE